MSSLCSVHSWTLHITSPVFPQEYNTVFKIIGDLKPNTRIISDGTVYRQVHKGKYLNLIQVTVK